MSLDQSFVGRTYPPTDSYEIGREKIREFAEAIGDWNPVYRDSAAAKALGYQDVIAPPTMAIVVSMRASAQVIGDPELGLDYSRVVHGEQRFVHTRPIRAGDQLSVVVSVESIRQAAGNDLISTKSDAVDQNGSLVFTAYSTIVARGTA
ncbi:acyl dehydratase [Jatrophihabitans sp. GAS493]|uniref:MaoC family dehydratase N-terminal domain-containing protein n=1 Tax=Jatrophihabitans sp. GAS493 TaxID=1907575 RepID=UPI000BB91FB2|nr:MaoC family dehydratase N-terminal domain-containing protein [Jatrophihabitans sp. GAS493]SOD72354.1 acyl dehydratase [Jatrophihabitans sp. GAS493]